jgi:hypothetical protein
LSSMWRSECNSGATRVPWIFNYLERTAVINMTPSVEISPLRELRRIRAFEVDWPLAAASLWRRLDLLVGENELQHGIAVYVTARPASRGK